MAKVLILDDQEVNRAYLTTLLGYAGHRVLEAADGASALTTTRSDHPDLIIADVLMPGMDGYEFARQLRNDPEIAHTPMMFYSGFYSESDARELARSCGVQHMLSKPSDPEVILQAVAAIVDSAPIPGTSPMAPEFDLQHSRLLTNRLCETVDHLQAINARLRDLLEIGRQFAAEHDEKPLIERLCLASQRILGCEYAGVVTFDSSSGPGTLVVRGTGNQTLDSLRALLSHEPLLASVCAGTDPIVVSDESVCNQVADLPAILGVPLRRSSGAFGVLLVLAKAGAVEFTAEDKQVAATISAQAAVAYENAIRYQEIRRHAAELEREIARRHEIEQALCEREESFRTLFEEAPVGLLLSCCDRRLVRVNRACCEMLGYTAEEMLSSHLSDVIHPDDLEAGLRAAQEVIAGSRPAVDVEMRWIRKTSETVWTQATIAVVREPGGTASQCLYVIQDVTERKQRDDEIRLLNRQLAQKVAELTAANQDLEVFTYSIAHDLRAPLRHMDGFSSILWRQLDQKLDPASLGYLQRVRDGAQQMGRMIDDLLKLAHTGRRGLNLCVSDVNALVEDVVRDLQMDTRGSSIEWRIGNLPAVACDPVLFRQALANLLDNAVKFTSGRNPAIIEVGAVDNGEEPVFFVRDNGVGFSMKYADKLFGIFQRLHPAGEFAGNGVGLATVQRIVRKHGGQIWAESQEERGSTFFFTLSAAASNHAAPNADSIGQRQDNQR